MFNFFLDNEGVQFIVNMIPPHLPDTAHKVVDISNNWIKLFEGNTLGTWCMKLVPGLFAKTIFDKGQKKFAEINNEW